MSMAVSFRSTLLVSLLLFTLAPARALAIPHKCESLMLPATAAEIATGEASSQASAWAAKRTTAEIISMFDGDPELKALLDAPAGVREGYSVREHVHRVFARFEEQRSLHGIRVIERRSGMKLFGLLKTIIPLHDIGKPLAVRAGNKDLQHEFTTPILVRKLEELGFTQAEIDLAVALLDHDILGDVTKGVMAPADGFEALVRLASRTPLTAREFFVLQSFFFTIDASSYPLLVRLFDNVNGKLLPADEGFAQLRLLFESR